ncbi:hypothetical protein [Luteibacter sp.]|uniref:hypothetical protein n=1 Tax=Luteibacter sp. TaxID=1886636 RepID=UPI002806A719|nr:hypothetical protein [Luteibacter sp.]MDQ8049801.1 hypothetical protein [Luteibacter sp.]
MRSSTSSFDIYLTRRAPPRGRWLLPISAAFVLFLALVGWMEWELARRGFRPTVVDSPELWSRERDRASALGSHAIVLIGASRAQLDLDLAILARDSGLQPVQLAIDGSSFLPVLSDLAADDSVTGTVLVDYQDANLVWRDHEFTALGYINFWRERMRHPQAIGFAASESLLATLRQRFLRTYADGAGPMLAVSRRLLTAHATPQYLQTLPGRERIADYSLVPMPDFYYLRVMRDAGIEDMSPAPDARAFEASLKQRVETLPEAPAAAFNDNVRIVASAVARIEARGGHVIFVAFPRSGLVLRADEVRFPRKRFWSPFVQQVGGKSLRFDEIPALAAFRCPDGSHLDAKDREPFTHALAETLATRGWIGQGRPPVRNEP